MNFSYYKPVPLIGLLFFILSSLYYILLPINNSFLITFISPIAITLIILLWYNRYMWKYCIFNLLVTVPNIGGKYAGNIQSSYKNDKGENILLLCDVEIKQTASSIIIDSTFYKDHDKSIVSSISKSKTAVFEITHNRQLLVFRYDNGGSISSNDGLHQHEGTTVLHINLEKGKTELDGDYYNNRNPQTKGYIHLERASK